MQRWVSTQSDCALDSNAFRTLPDLPGFRIYANGEIWGPSGTRLSRRPNDKGYLTFSGPRVRPRSQKCYRVHVVVCRAFHGEKPFPAAVARHLDGDRKNNGAWNLCWGTHKENADDRDRHGRTPYGMDNTAAKLTDRQVAEIRAEYAGGVLTQLEIAKQYGVSRSLVGQIARGEIRQRPVGWHQWTAPTDEQIKTRMLARRAART